MKVLRRIGVFLVVLIAGLALVGFFLPAQYHVERSITVNAPPDKVFAIASSFKTWESWTAWNLQMDPTLQRSISGTDSAVGSTMSWEGKKAGQGEMKLTKVTSPQEFSYDLEFDHGRYKSVGTMTFQPSGEGTTVLWTDEGSMGGNPFLHWMGLAMDKMIGPDFEKGLQGLKALAEKKSG
jgi:uncharacterized protein YndB with AHSA1/START domain